MTDIIALSEKSITLERNQYLKMKGSIDTNVYYIESGSVKIFILDDNEEQIIRFGYKKNMIVALDSFFTHQPSQLYIQAIRRTVIKVISKQRLQQFLESDEGTNAYWISTLENLILQQFEREIDILTSSPKERYERVLRRSPQLFQEVPHKYIANYLRMSAETLSRLKNLDFNQDLEKK